MENSIFEEVIENNISASEDLMISPSIQVDPREYTFAAGIEIQVNGLNMPIFLSSAELRALADEADNIAEEMIGNTSQENHMYH